MKTFAGVKKDPAPTPFDKEPVTFDSGTRFLQWKGTDVCMDVICLCGHTAHLHGDFMYFLHCPQCDRVYHNPSVARLIELTGPDRDYALKGYPHLLEDEDDRG